MKDFIKVFLLLIAGILFFAGIALLSMLGPVLIMFLRIVIVVTVIGGGILLLRNKWSHRLPKEREREHREEYKRQFRHH